MHCQMREEGVEEVEQDQSLREQQLVLKSFDLIVPLEVHLVD